MLTLATPLAPSHHPTRPKLSKQTSKCACAPGGQKWAERPWSEVGSRGPRGGARGVRGGALCPRPSPRVRASCLPGRCGGVLRRLRGRV